jgi:hypothetical protein
MPYLLSELTHSPKKTLDTWSVDSIIVKRVAAQGCSILALVSLPVCGGDNDALTWGVMTPLAMAWAKAADHHCMQN